jgi:hypothetical protein
MSEEMVVVCGSGEVFHAAVQPATLWRAECGTGVGSESVYPRSFAEAQGWRPCRRCYEP